MEALVLSVMVYRLLLQREKQRIYDNEMAG